MRYESTPCGPTPILETDQEREAFELAASQEVDFWQRFHAAPTAEARQAVIDEECWPYVFKPIPGFPGYYANRQGTIGRHSRDGHRPPRMLGGWKTLKGSMVRGTRVYTLPKDGKRVFLTDRQAVLKAFGETWPAKKSHLFKLTPEQHDQPGERNGNHRLTADEVREIRKMYASGDWTQRELAREFGVAQGNIAFIVTNRTWRHLLPTTGQTQ